MKPNLTRSGVRVFSGALLAAVAIWPALAQTTAAEKPMAVGGGPGVGQQRHHRPVEFRYDAQGHKLRDPATNAAVTTAFSGYQAGAAFYTQASQQWTVPTVAWGQSTGTGTQYSSFWVGIQGNSTTLVQLGTEQEASSNGSTRYYPWYEVYPAGEVQISLPVYPGDLMSASLSCSAPCTANTTQTWVLWMQDATQGWTWTHAFSFNNGPSNYAEWIMEAPYSGGVLPLADYAVATFATVTANNVAPSLSSSNGLVMQDPDLGHRSLSIRGFRHLLGLRQLDQLRWDYGDGADGKPVGEPAVDHVGAILDADLGLDERDFLYRSGL